MLGTGEIPQDPKEILRDSVVFKGIDGKTNGLTNFDGDRQAFLNQHSEQIARWALTGESNVTPSYRPLGLDGIETSAFLKLKFGLPEKAAVATGGINPETYYKSGSRDAITFLDDQTILFAWQPAQDGIKYSAGLRNVLIAQLKPDGLRTIQDQLAKDPTGLYGLLIDSLYPESQVALTENEIMQAVESSGNAVVSGLSVNQPQEAEQARQKIVNGDLFVKDTIAKSTLKRRTPCIEVVKV